jgi:hypothetical protein
MEMQYNQLYPYFMDNTIYLMEPSIKYFIFSSSAFGYLLNDIIDHQILFNLCSMEPSLQQHLTLLETFSNDQLAHMQFNNISMCHEYLYAVFLVYKDIAKIYPEFTHFMFMAYQRELAFVYNTAYYHYGITEESDSYQFLCNEIISQILSSSRLLNVRMQGGDPHILHEFFNDHRNHPAEKYLLDPLLHIIISPQHVNFDRLTINIKQNNDILSLIFGWIFNNQSIYNISVVFRDEFISY